MWSFCIAFNRAVLGHFVSNCSKQCIFCFKLKKMGTVFLGSQVPPCSFPTMSLNCLNQLSICSYFFHHWYRFWTRYFLNQMISQLWLWLEILSIHFTFWISLSSSSLSPWLYLSCSFVFVSRSSSLFFSERFSGYTWNAFATSSLPLTHVGQVKLWFPFPSCFGVVPTRLIYLLWRDVHMHQLSICH